MIKIGKKFLLPNAITTLNLFFGFWSIIMSVEGNFVMASWSIVLAIIFDGLDGKVARKLEAYSHFGQEFDSFSDSVSFGIAPSILIYLTLVDSNYFRFFIILLPFIFLLSGILRLVRFNIITNLSGEKGEFIGMPIPTGAGLIASYYIFTNAVWGDFLGLNLFVMIIIFSTLSMVSNVSYQNPVQIIYKFKYEIISIIILSLPFAKYLVFPYFLLYVLINNFKSSTSSTQRNRYFFTPNR